MSSEQTGMAHPDRLPHVKVCEIEDFAEPALTSVLREVLPHELARHGPEWPAKREYRKDWEVAMAVRALRAGACLSATAEILGIGAGNEPTIFWLTTQAARVFATDLYLAEGTWEESANRAMLTDPGRYWPGAWNPRRLVVQQMDARELRYEDASFDALFSSSSLEHFGDLDDVARSLDEAARVLRPGGILSLSTELRLTGEGPGLPGVLLFEPSQLLDLVVADRPWELVGEPALTPSSATLTTARPFAEAAADVRRHVAEYGALYFHRLRWSGYPHVVLTEGQHSWTSVHLALRRR